VACGFDSRLRHYLMYNGAGRSRLCGQSGLSSLSNAAAQDQESYPRNSVWRSLVALFSGENEVVGSNPTTLIVGRSVAWVSVRKCVAIGPLAEGLWSQFVILCVWPIL
jgi:hypothetical protein